ncbi:MAG TPA: ASCH domain-containing protein [Deltaproteobacteria bacterium]|nr:ASCH domain-containing protein [Deltaproteobacteria bacterium]
MPALNFKRRFAPDVASWRKRQTIRAKRKDGRNPQPGNRLYFFTGLRTKYCQPLGTAICKSAEDILIYPNGQIALKTARRVRYLSAKEKDKLAVDDGFHDFPDFMSFFTKEHDLPFWGLLIKW